MSNLCTNAEVNIEDFDSMTRAHKETVVMDIPILRNLAVRKPA